MPHECTSCGRVFDDGSKEMLSGCPDCDGNTFQFHPEDGEPAPESAPPEPPEPSRGSSVARTVGKTAATVRDLVGGSGGRDSGLGGEPAPAGSGGDPGSATGASASATAVSREDSAQASARSDVVTPDELPARDETDTEHRFDPVDVDDGSAESRSAGSASATSADATGVDPDEARPDGPAAGVDGSSADATGDADGDPAVPDDRSDSRSSAQADDRADGDSVAGADRPDLEQLRAELNDQFESIKVLEPGQYELNLMELYDREEYIIALQEDGRYSIQVPDPIRD